MNEVGVWPYLAGAFFTLWNSVHTLMFKFMHGDIGKLSDKIDSYKEEREDKCVPRTECNITHKRVDETLERIDKNVLALHSRMDKIIIGREHER